MIAIAYTSAIIQGEQIKRMGVQKYIGRVKEQGRTSRRYSTFYIGLHGRGWVDSVERYAEIAAELMKLSSNKRKYYQLRFRAVKLIQSRS